MLQRLNLISVPGGEVLNHWLNLPYSIWLTHSHHFRKKTTTSCLSNQAQSYKICIALYADKTLACIIYIIDKFALSQLSLQLTGRTFILTSLKHFFSFYVSLLSFTARQKWWGPHEFRLTWRQICTVARKQGWVNLPTDSYYPTLSSLLWQASPHKVITFFYFFS